MNHNRAFLIILSINIFSLFIAADNKEKYYNEIEIKYNLISSKHRGMYDLIIKQVPNISKCDYNLQSELLLKCLSNFKFSDYQMGKPSLYNEGTLIWVNLYKNKLLTSHAINLKLNILRDYSLAKKYYKLILFRIEPSTKIIWKPMTIDGIIKGDYIIYYYCEESHSLSYNLLYGNVIAEIHFDNKYYNLINIKDYNDKYLIDISNKFVDELILLMNNCESIKEPIRSNSERIK